MAGSKSNKPGRYTAKFWEARVFRPAYVDRRGDQQECTAFYVRVKHAGRRKSVPLGTADRAEAGRKAAAFYGRLRAVGWAAALRELDHQRVVPTCATNVSDVIRALNAAGMRARTVANYASALRWFAARSLGLKADRATFGPKGSADYRQKVESVHLPELTDETVTAIMTRLEAEAGRDASARRSARISAASFLRNAKAALRAAVEQGMTLPEPRPFAGVKKPGGTQPPKYVSTFDAAQLLRDAKRELKTTPAAYVAILLALGAGLRRSEIRNLRWRHVDKDRNRILVLPTGTWQTKTAESEAAVDVDPGLLAELEPYRSHPDDHPTTPLGLDAAVAWLRKRGVNGFMPLHTLRKEFGSLICADADLLTASRQLRHNDLATTASVYVEGRKRAAPKISAMLQPPRKPPTT